MVVTTSVPGTMIVHHKFTFVYFPSLRTLLPIKINSGTPMPRFRAPARSTCSELTLLDGPTTKMRYQPMGIHRTNKVTIRSAHCFLLYGVTLGPTKIRTRRHTTTTTTMPNAICVGSMLLRPYSLPNIFAGQQTGALDRFQGFVEVAGQRLAESIYHAVELIPEFSRPVLAISYRRYEAKAKWTHSRPLGTNLLGPGKRANR